MSRAPADLGARVSPKAYDFYLRGLSCFAKHSGQDTIYAWQMFQRAIDIEPGFGKAWTARAGSWN